MLREIATNIKKEIDEKINSIYNHRKETEGLVSVHNTMLKNLRKKLNEWYAEEITTAERIENMRLNED